jgi:hypothetical protein
MPVKCPVCETPNADEAAECSTCGKILFADADLVDDVAPIEGLEETLHDPLESGTAPVAPLLELERTQLARKDLRVALEVVPGVERTQLEADPDAIPLWSGGVDLDLGREPDDGQRTPAPRDNGLCPWCSAPAAGAVCDNCGRRRSRYTVPVATAAATRAQGDNVLCPSCFARVPPGDRCVECGVPFAVVEL